MKPSLIAIALMIAAALLQHSITANAQAASDDPPDAATMLSNMTRYLAALDAFSVRSTAGYDVLQDDGQVIEFVEARDIALARPNQLRISEVAGAEHGRTVVFDGTRMVVADPTAQVYAEAPQPGTVDDAIVYFIRELGMRLPLAAFLTTRLPDELGKRVTSVAFVESTHALGQPAHHLAGRTALVDFQVWIAAGDQPLPLRIVLTYPDEGRPQYWTQFSDWNLEPSFTQTHFAFSAPAGSQRIAFAAQFVSHSGNAEDGAQP